MLIGSPTAYIGQYQVRERLGGSRAQVYKVWNPADNRLRALKLLTREAANDSQRVGFLLEAQVLEKIVHPNIVAVQTTGEDEHGQPYEIMELLQGQTLKDAIRRTSFGPILDRVMVALQVARALEHLHFLNIVHRRLRPEDIHIDTTGKVRLLSIGIGRPDSESRFRAPEAAQGEATERGDIFTFGAILYELLGGPRNATILETPLPEVPLSLQDLIRRCTSVEPSHRPASFTLVAAELDRWIANPNSISTQSRRWLPLCIPRKSAPAVAAGACVALGLFSYAAFLGGLHLGQQGHAASAGRTAPLRR